MDWNNVYKIHNKKNISAVTAAIRASKKDLLGKLESRNAIKKAQKLEDAYNMMVTDDELMRKLSIKVNDAMPRVLDQAQQLYEVSDTSPFSLQYSDQTAEQERRKAWANFHAKKDAYDKCKNDAMTDAAILSQTKADMTAALKAAQSRQSALSAVSGQFGESLFQLMVPYAYEAIKKTSDKAIQKVMYQTMQKIVGGQIKLDASNLETAGSVHLAASEEKGAITSQQKSDVIYEGLGYSVKNYASFSSAIHILSAANFDSMMDQWSHVNEAVKSYVYASLKKHTDAGCTIEPWDTIDNLRSLITLQALVGQKNLNETKASYLVIINRSNKKHPFNIIPIAPYLNAIVEQAGVVNLKWEPEQPLVQDITALQKLKLSVSLKLSVNFLKQLKSSTT